MEPESHRDDALIDVIHNSIGTKTPRMVYSFLDNPEANHPGHLPSPSVATKLVQGFGQNDLKEVKTFEHANSSQ